MYWYGVCATATFDTVAGPALETLGALDRTIVERDSTSIFAAYNRILARGHGPLVLVHDDVEIRDRYIESKLAEVFADDSVGVVGVVGSRGSQTVRTWAGERSGRIDSPYGLEDFGPGDVDMVDGLLMALSPWVVDNIRFDEARYTGFHGYDADLCRTVSARGKRIVIADIDVYHHCKIGYGDSVALHRADIVHRRKWGLRQDAWHVRVRRLHPRIQSVIAAVRR